MHTLTLIQCKVENWQSCVITLGNYSFVHLLPVTVNEQYYNIMWSYLIFTGQDKSYLSTRVRRNGCVGIAHYWVQFSAAIQNTLD